MDAEAPPYGRDAGEVVAALESNADSGLTGTEAAARLSKYGPNEITKEKPPSMWAVAAQQLRDPMNIMLIAVVAVSFVIGEVSTGVIVGLLILLNVVLGTRQELKARASIDALANLQVPQAKVVRDGSVALVPAVDLVPGDIVEVEAGDIVPADGRIVHSATLETQEAALTGESAPIPKDAGALAGTDVALGDRSNMLFQNTAVTRGTGAMVVTATGMETEMGKIATMLTSVTRTRSPLQKELGKLTYVLGIIAWGAVAFIVVVGVARGEKLQRRPAARHGDGDLGDPDGHAGVRVGPAVDGCEAARRREGRRQEPHRRRDAGRDERDQHRQDRHADAEPDDGVDPVHGRRVVHGRGRGLPQDRRPHVGRRRTGARLHASGARPRPRQRRDRRRRRERGRRPDGSGARRARGQARRRRGGDAAGLSAHRRGAVRLRLQVHGHLPPLLGGRNRARHPARQGRPRRRARALHARPAGR